MSCEKNFRTSKHTHEAIFSVLLNAYTDTKKHKKKENNETNDDITYVKPKKRKKKYCKMFQCKKKIDIKRQ